MNNCKLDSIIEKLGKENIMLQAAEEASEMSQASLKMIRVSHGTTPVSAMEAVNGLLEEIADVLVCIDAVGKIMGAEFIEEVEKIKSEKIDRWYLRTFNEEMQPVSNILGAIRAVQKECEKHPNNCSGCPFNRANNSTSTLTCMLTWKKPKDWLDKKEELQIIHDELIDAIKVIKEECKKHLVDCANCPFSQIDDTGESLGCRLGWQTPEYWPNEVEDYI